MGNMKDKATDWTGDEQHSSDEDFLCLLDGELEPRRAAEVRLHLEACWSCRARSEKFQKAISSFVEYRSLVLKPSIRMPESKSGFESRFRQAMAKENAKPGFWEKWRGNLSSRFKSTNRGDFSLFAKLFDVRKNAVNNFYHLRERLSARVIANSVTAALVLTSVLTAYIFWFAAAPVVSAEELLNRAEAAYKKELRVNQQPVIYQQIQVSKRKSGAANNRNESAGPPQPVKLELWQDANNSRMKQAVTAVQANSPVSLPAGGELPDTSAAELTAILRANGFAPPSPLSVRGFRAWRGSLAEKSESVEELKGDDGAQLLRLSVTAGSTSENSSGARIVAASLTVRGNDSHPLQQSFRVVTGDGATEDYEVRETSFAVLDLASLEPGFFNDGETAAIPADATKPPPIVALPASNDSNAVFNGNLVIKANEPTVSANTNTKTGAVAADADLEVEVISLLHSAGADTGEQVEVNRQANGPVVINGIVETEKRKKEIIAALRSVQENPAVRINVKTVEEAIAEQNQIASKLKQNNKNPSGVPNVQLEMRSVEGKSFAAEAEVRAYFVKQGAGDDAVKKYAAGVVSRSNEAMRYTYALRRLKAQFTPEQFKNLKPEARTKWLGLVKSYASSYQNEINALRRELQPVFGGVSNSGNAAGIGSDAEIFAAIDQMFAAGEASDRAVKAAFTTSDAKSAGSGLKSAQFWNNLGNAEVLAKNLQTVK